HVVDPGRGHVHPVWTGSAILARLLVAGVRRADGAFTLEGAILRRALDSRGLDALAAQTRRIGYAAGARVRGRIVPRRNQVTHVDALARNRRRVQRDADVDRVEVDLVGRHAVDGRRHPQRGLVVEPVPAAHIDLAEDIEETVGQRRVGRLLRNGAL